MANEFIARKGLISLGDSQITGSNSLAGNYALKVTNTSGADILNVENDGNVILPDGILQPQNTIQQKYYTNTSNNTIKFGSAYELFGTTHGSGGYIYYLSPNNWTSGWHLAIGNESAKHSFSNAAYTSPGQIYTTNIRMGSNLNNYETSPHTGLKYSSQNGWTFVIRGGDNTNKLLINSSGNTTISGSLTANQGIDVTGDVSASTYYGDGSNLTNLPTQDPFPYTGSAIISGSLEVEGNTTITSPNSLTGNYNFQLETPQGWQFRAENDGNIRMGARGSEYVKWDFNSGNRVLNLNNFLIQGTSVYDLRFQAGTNADILFGGETFGFGNSYNQPKATISIRQSNTNFPNSEVNTLSFAKHVNHLQPYTVIQTNDDAYGSNTTPQGHPLYLYAGQNTSTGVFGHLILQSSPQNGKKGNVGIGLEDPQTNLHISGAVSASTYYGDGSNLTGIAGISFNGSTANGLVTYGSATTADVESKLTFDASTLLVSSVNIDSTGVKIYGGVAFAVSPYITPEGNHATLNFGDATSGLYLQMQNNKISFDNDATNTYIWADTSTPENLEIHADGNIELRADDELQIFSDIDVTGDITASGDLSINGFPSVSASLAAASGGGGSTYRTWISGKGQNTSQVTYGTAWRGSMSGHSQGAHYVPSADTSLITFTGTPSVGDTNSANNYKIITTILHPNQAFTNISWNGFLRAYNSACDGNTQNMEVWTLDDINDLDGYGSTTLTYRGGSSWTYATPNAFITPNVVSGSISYTGTSSTAFIVTSHVPTNPASSMQFVYNFDFTIT